MLPVGLVMGEVMRCRASVAGLILLLALGRAASAATADADPENGQVDAGRFDNPYFSLHYPLPERWEPDRAGPPPSRNGAYVLTALTVRSPARATLQFGAQDLFFDANPPATALAAAQALQASISAIDGMAIDRPAEEITLAGHRFARLDYNGAGLYHAYFATMLRCHLVSAAATATDSAALDQIAASFGQLQLDAGDDPVCAKDYAGPETLLQQPAPVLTGPKFTKIPVRVVIGPDGTVRHIHVINARPEQRGAIEAAVKGWQFKPYRQGDQNVAVETGLSFEVK